MSDPTATPIRDAASIVLFRTDAGRPQVLMGQRGTGAAFMPDKFVFPGGAVDPADMALDDDVALDSGSARALAVDAPQALVRALPLTAIRELWEETGLMLGALDPAASVRADAAPAAWRGFLAAGLRPRTDALRFVFRAVTPPGRPRRFDARFFLADAIALAGETLRPTTGDSELRQLQWIDIDAARALPLPFITGIVLSEIDAALAELEMRRPAPYFWHDHRGSYFRMI